MRQVLVQAWRWVNLHCVSHDCGRRPVIQPHRIHDSGIGAMVIRDQDVRLGCPLPPPDDAASEEPHAGKMPNPSTPAAVIDHDLYLDDLLSLTHDQKHLP